MVFALAAVRPTAAADVLNLGDGLTKLSGVDSGSGISYSRIMLKGILVKPAAAPDASTLPATSSAPVLVGQCTHTLKGKYVFELFVDYGGVEDTSFHAPWRSSGPADLYPPATQKATIIFAFTGYTRVKPVSRQWETVPGVAFQWRYNNPGGGSRNMEEASYYLQYLRALPTLRLTHGGDVAQFNTGVWLEAVRKDALCRASGL